MFCCFCCLALKIHVSDVTRIYLEKCGGFQLQHRGTIAVKVKYHKVLFSHEDSKNVDP